MAWRPRGGPVLDQVERGGRRRAVTLSQPTTDLVRCRPHRGGKLARWPRPPARSRPRAPREPAARPTARPRCASATSSTAADPEQRHAERHQAGPPARDRDQVPVDDEERHRRNGVQREDHVLRRLHTRQVREEVEVVADRLVQGQQLVERRGRPARGRAAVKNVGNRAAIAPAEPTPQNATMPRRRRDRAVEDVEPHERLRAPPTASNPPSTRTRSTVIGVYGRSWPRREHLRDWPPPRSASAGDRDAGSARRRAVPLRLHRRTHIKLRRRRPRRGAAPRGPRCRP